MSILIREGIKAISQLQIDINKDWLLFGINNIRELVAGMSIGDIIARGNEVLVKIAPSIAGYVLTSGGPLHLPAWLPAPSLFTWYFPVWLELSKNAENFTPDKLMQLLAPLLTSHPTQTTPDGTAELTSSKDAVIAVPTEISKVTGSPYNDIPYYQFLLDGAIATYGPTPPSDHDETAESRSETTNDMHLPPQNANIPPDECYYFGCLHQFNYIWIDVTTAGVGNFAIDTKYWDGAAWSVPPDLVDHLNDFQSSGIHDVHFTIPGDWALKNIGGYNLYWIKISCVSMVTLTTAPLAKKSWVQITY